MICMKNLRFSSRPRIKVRRQGPPGSARAQPWTGVHYFREKVPLLRTASDQNNVFGMHTLSKGHHTFLFSPTSPRPTTVNILHIALHVNDTIFLKITFLYLDENVCRKCRQESPPKSRRCKSRIINWVQCDKCRWWYHV